jgi:hypothetical protein
MLLRPAARSTRRLGAIAAQLTERLRLRLWEVFSVSQRSAREGRNPATGEPIAIVRATMRRTPLGAGSVEDLARRSGDGRTSRRR